jgi:uncharacterized protein (DUF433 family)
MDLKEYFDFLAADDIRIKGTRVGIETVLHAFIHRSRTPEEIACSFPTVTLEQVYATVLYYLHNKEEVDRYLTEWLEWGRRMREEQRRNPSPAVRRLMELKAAQQALKAAQAAE